MLLRADLQRETARALPGAGDLFEKGVGEIGASLRAELPEAIDIGGAADRAAVVGVVDEAQQFGAPGVVVGGEQPGAAMRDGAGKRAGGRGDGGNIDQRGFEVFQLAFGFAERVADLERCDVDVEPRELGGQIGKVDAGAPFDAVGVAGEGVELFDHHHVGAVRRAEQHEADLRAGFQHVQQTGQGDRKILLMRGGAGRVADAYEMVGWRDGAGAHGEA